MSSGPQFPHLSDGKKSQIGLVVANLSILKELPLLLLVVFRLGTLGPVSL